MKNKIFAFIMSHRILVSSLFLLITIYFGWFAAHVKFDNTIETYFEETELLNYNRFLEQFGTDEIIVVAFGGEDIFTQENLHLIDTMSKKLESLPHINRVLSLTTVEIVHGEEGFVSFEPLIDEIPSNSDELNVIKQKALSDSIIPGTLISHDAKNTAVVAELEHIIGKFDYKIDLLKEIRKFVQETEEKTGKHFYIGGTSVLDDAIFRYTENDQKRFQPLMMLVVVVIIFVMFRRIAMTLLPLFVIIIASVWTYGFLVILGYKINVISTIISPLILAIAIADSMHIIADYLQENARGTLSKNESIERAFKNLIAPCFMTSITTVFGLLSLLSADLVPIRQFGLVGAVGVLFAFIITISILPILLSILPVPKEEYHKIIQEGLFSKILRLISRWDKKRSLVVIIISFLLTIPAIISLTHVTVGTNSLDYLKQDDDVRRQIEWIDSHLAGTTSLEFLIEADAENNLKSPILLNKIEEFQNYLKNINGITGVYSIVDLIKTLNKAFNNGDEQQNIIPSSSIEVAQELSVIEGSKDLESFVSYDYTKGRITARVDLRSSQKLVHRMPEIEEYMHELFTDTAKVTPAGIIYLLHQMEGYLLSSQMKSFLLAFIVISLLIIFMLRSFKLGILAMVPNILPILFTIGLMPLLGINLDVGTVMIAGIALGLVVDDSIHFLSRLKMEMRSTDDTKIAISKTLQNTGRPITFTSIILILGFMVLLFASFNPIIHFGVLSGIVIFFALLFDLIVLPAIIGFIGFKRR